jgi:branched-chain amino acid transport system ATP-binding protein
VLDVRELCMDFGGVRALDFVDLAVRPGEIAALIGPNGAGKTTLFNCVTGLNRPTAGEILARRPGEDPLRLDGLAPHRVTRLGVARTFQAIRLFAGLTALQNVLVGRHCRTRAGVLGALARDRRTRAEEAEALDFCRGLLDRLSLSRFAGEPAGSLPYGAQRRLEIARALASEPFLLLLDEPAAGMNPQETAELREVVLSIRAGGVSVLLIEHDMRMVMGLSDTVFVLDYGRRIAAGRPGEVRRDPAVVRAYLGEEEPHG